jgi:hypothetical protein
VGIALPISSLGQHAAAIAVVRRDSETQGRRLPSLLLSFGDLKDHFGRPFVFYELAVNPPRVGLLEKIDNGPMARDYERYVHGHYGCACHDVPLVSDAKAGLVRQ